MERNPRYAPLLFTTTVRSPERMKDFLRVLKEYDGKTLTDKLATEIAGAAISSGVYKPTKIAKEVRVKIKEEGSLTDDEIDKILHDNPQKHKEAGFSKGWPSRFDTWFKLAKELGFVFYRAGEKIRFSEIGLKLVDIKHPEFEQQAFLNAFVKYQRNNPFRRVKNENVPLILLLQTITKLNEDKDFNDAGISKYELPLVIYWKDDDAEALYQRIKKLRQDFGFSPSGEVITDICRNEIMERKDIKRNSRSLMADYPDEFVRKMRLTGLISIRGGGRFIDINRRDQEKVNYVLANYSDYEKYDTEEDYFEYVSTVDERLVSFAPVPVSAQKQDEFLQKWLDIYTWETIKKELLRLSQKQSSQDKVLRYLSNPVRLEFLTTLAVKSRFPGIEVIPNYPVDDEGIPTATAAGVGNTGDIECFEDANGILIEVTMAEGVMQTRMEIWPIGRHLEEFSKKAENSMCYFVAPSIFADSVKQIKYLRQEDKLFIFPKTIKEFLTHLEQASSLYQVSDS